MRSSRQIPRLFPHSEGQRDVSSEQKSHLQILFCFFSMNVLAGFHVYAPPKTDFVTFPLDNGCPADQCGFSTGACGQLCHARPRLEMGYLRRGAKASWVQSVLT